MSMLRAAVVFVLALLTLGQALQVNCTIALATAAILFSMPAAYAERAEDYKKAGNKKVKSGDY